MTSSQFADLIAWVEARLPRLTDEIVATVVDHVPLYREGRRISMDELHSSIDDNLRFLVSGLAHPRRAPDLSVPRGTGRRRAQQGVPLPEVLQVYRISFATLWDTLVGHARNGYGAALSESLLTTSTLIWRLADEHATALTEAYRAATAELVIAQQHRRAALVEVLLTGRLGPDAGPWEASALLGFPPDGHLMVVAAHTRSLAEASLPGIERLLADQGIDSGWRLTTSLQLGVVSLQPEQLETVLDTLRATAQARAGASPLYRSPADTPRSLRLARSALAEIPPSSLEVRMFSSSPIAALMASEPDEGRRLGEQVLGAVLALPGPERATLLATLDAYLERSGSAVAAAEDLHCHPNTVRYRLRRVQELTGRSLSDPNQVTELAAAAYAIRLGGGAAAFSEDRSSGTDPGAATAR
jgi:hypothetical protein